MRPSIRRGAAAAALLALAACDGPATLSPESRLRLMQAAGQERPSDPAALAQWAATAEAAGNFVEAAAANRALMEREGRSEARLLAIGRLFLRAGDAAGAAQAYSEALAFNPRSAAAANGLGLAYDLGGNPWDAQQAYRRGLSANPSDWTLRSNLGVSLVSTGAAQEAASVLAEAEVRAEAPTHARHNLALAFVAGGQMDRAVRVLRSEMGPVEARTMAEGMGAFARWVGSRPAAAMAPASLQRTERLALDSGVPVAAAPFPVSPPRAAEPAPPPLAMASAPAPLPASPPRAEPAPSPLAMASAPSETPTPFRSAGPSGRVPLGAARDVGAAGFSISDPPAGGRPVLLGGLVANPGADEALRSAERALEASPNNAAARLAAGEAAVLAGSFERAEALLSEGRARGAEELRMALLESRIARARGDSTRARRALEEASRLRQEQLRTGG